MPELTRPTSITVMAEEDWIAMVMPAPRPMPAKRFEVTFFSERSKEPPASLERPLDRTFMPYMKNARPPKSIKTFNKMFMHKSPFNSVYIFVFRRIKNGRRKFSVRDSGRRNLTTFLQRHLSKIANSHQIQNNKISDKCQEAILKKWWRKKKRRTR